MWLKGLWWQDILIIAARVTKTTNMKTTILAIFAFILSINTFADTNNVLFAAGQAAPGIENSTLHAISSDAAGNTYVTGTLIKEGYNELFIAKYDFAGGLQWMQAADGGGHYGNNSYSISLDQEGNAYITGTFSGTAIFGAQQLKAKGAANMFLAKYDAAGNLQWVKQANGNGYESQVRGNEISLDKNGEVVVTGQVLNLGDFGTQQLAGTGNYEARYSTNGELVSVALVQ